MACETMQRPAVPPLAVNTAVPESKNMLQSTQQKLRIVWDKTMNNPSRSVQHEKTSVLLISWDPDQTDLKVEEEVTELRETFRETYGFSVTETQLEPHQARKQALADISKFVLDEDAERSLLIIYYAGHGFSDEKIKPGDLGLAAKAPKLGADVGLKEWKESIVWSKIETAIGLVENSDVLLIFDCCNAGRLCRPVRSADPRNHYQVLGACSEDQTTRGPGRHSFTNALIWALKALSKEESFSTSKLRNKIMECPEFPDDQIPALSVRENREVEGDIVICRKGLALGAPRLTPTKSENEGGKARAYLDLRFVFDGEMSDGKVEETAKELRKFRDGEAGQKLDLTRITFQSKYTANEYAALRFREAVLAGMKKSPSGITPIAVPLVKEAIREHAQIIAHQVQADVQQEADHRRIEALEDISQQRETGLQKEAAPGKEVGGSSIEASPSYLLPPESDKAKRISMATTDVEESQAQQAEDSINHHVKAIGRKLRESIIRLFSSKKRRSIEVSSGVQRADRIKGVV